MADRIISDLSTLGKKIGLRGSSGEKSILADLDSNDLELRAQSDIPYVVKEEISLGFLQKHLHLVADTKDLIKDIGDEFRNGMEELAEKFLESTSLPSQIKAVKRASDRGFFSCEFEIYDSKSGREYLERELGWYHHVDEDNLVVVFRLPRPVDWHWDKGNNGSTVKSTANLWGDSYDELITRVWDIWNISDEKYSLDLVRINEVGEHEKGNFYYIWEVSGA